MTAVTKPIITVAVTAAATVIKLTVFENIGICSTDVKKCF
jgi:hypothetical protein